MMRHAAEDRFLMAVIIIIMFWMAQDSTEVISQYRFSEV